MKRILVLLILAAGATQAQQQQPVAAQQPDCVIFFTLTSATNSGSLNNRTVACSNWTVAYTSSGFSGLTLTFQDAPDNAGVAGSWVTFAGTVVSGSAAMTAITQTQSTFTGYYPWIRVNLSGLTGTGTVSGVFYGWRNSADIAAGGGGGGSVPNPIMVVGPDAPGAPSTQNPVQISGNDGTNTRAIKTDSSGRTQSVGPDADGAVSTASPVQIAGNDGTNVQTIKTDTTGRVFAVGSTQAAVPLFFCDLQASISITGSGNTQIVAASGSTSIYVCNIFVQTATPEDLGITTGTGSNCATGNTTIVGSLPSVFGFAFDFNFGPMKTSASQALCVNQSAAQVTKGFIKYAQY